MVIGPIQKKTELIGVPNIEFDRFDINSGERQKFEAENAITSKYRDRISGLTNEQRRYAILLITEVERARAILERLKTVEKGKYFKALYTEVKGVLNKIDEDLISIVKGEQIIVTNSNSTVKSGNQTQLVSPLNINQAVRLFEFRYDKGERYDGGGLRTVTDVFHTVPKVIDLRNIQGTTVNINGQDETYVGSFCIRDSRYLSRMLWRKWRNCKYFW